jgi:Flp pilus assembly protein TadB
MKLSLQIILALFVLLITNTTSFAAVSFNISTESEGIKNTPIKAKAKHFFKERVVKKVKQKVKKIKNIWREFKEKSDYEGIGIGSVLTLLVTAVFITLKITGIIAWSWLWVLAPLWIPIALLIVVFLFILILGLIGSLS